MLTFWKLIIGGNRPQTPAEDFLVKTLIQKIREATSAKIINLGAGESVVIENYLVQAGCDFTEDRLDLESIRVEPKCLGRQFVASVENMPIVPTQSYDLAFANYLLEHVEKLLPAAQEIQRILKPGGIFVTAVPNPAAMEFLIARVTPLWFHRLIRGQKAWATYYAFKNIGELTKIFEQAGFVTCGEHYWGNTLSYLARFPLIGFLALAYDTFINIFKIKFLAGNVCLIFRKGD